MVPHENLCALPSDKVWLRPCMPGVMQAHEKCAMKMKERRKNDGRVKFFLLEGGLYKSVSEDWLVRFR